MKGSQARKMLETACQLKRNFNTHCKKTGPIVAALRITFRGQNNIETQKVFLIDRCLRVAVENVVRLPAGFLPKTEYALKQSIFTSPYRLPESNRAIAFIVKNLLMSKDKRVPVLPFSRFPDPL